MDGKWTGDIKYGWEADPWTGEELFSPRPSNLLQISLKSHLLVGQSAMYLVSLESSLKMQELGDYFMLISYRLFELSKF